MTEPALFAFFAAMGITSLADTVEAGTVADLVGPDSLALYVRLAHVRWDGPPGEHSEQLAAHFGWLRASAIATDSPNYLEIDDVPYVLTQRGPLRSGSGTGGGASPCSPTKPPPGG